MENKVKRVMVKRERIGKLNKRGQVTIFIIIAIIVVASVLAYFTLRGFFSSSSVSQEFEQIYSSFLTCLEDDILTGASILGSQGGYIYLPEFESGSEFMPFSSQLNFLGNPVPYWSYVSGNNLEREQVPSKSDMENDLASFIEARVRDCELQSYTEQGFLVSMQEPDAKVSIGEDFIEVNLDMGMNMAKGNESVSVESHKVKVSSALGSLYDSARKVYDDEKDNLFLEEYAVDILRLYAPVDGVEIRCSPLTWNADAVFDDLQEAIEINVMALNNPESDYYSLDFSDLPGKHNVRFLNSRLWPSSFEVSPNEGNFLMANPIGNQQGLGIIGFCYVPYHFLYNMKYPVMIQVYNEKNPEEIFQFPVAVILENNKARQEGPSIQASQDVELELCKYKDTPVEVSVINKDFAPVNASISYECLGQRCSIGQAENGILNKEFPQCANGFVVASAEGYKTGKYLFSTVNSGNIEVILDKKYRKSVSLSLEGEEFNGDAIITFISDENIETIVYPENKFVELSEGQYNLTVQSYQDSEMKFGETTAEQCVEVPRGNVLGIFGLKEEKCFDVEVPEQKISQVLVGGGQARIFISEEDLSESNKIKINVKDFPVPETLEELQVNYVLFDNAEIGIEFI